jgi:hypothetical protein
MITLINLLIVLFVYIKTHNTIDMATAFCPSTNEAFDDTSLMRKYTGISILPSQEIDASNRNSDEFETLTSNFLTNHVLSIKGTVIPAPP